jgi:hypothetical protein
MPRNIASADQFLAAEVGKQFRTVGCTRVYTIIQRRMVLGFIPAVVGRSLDGKFTTDARVADIILLSESDASMDTARFLAITE